MLDEIGAGKIAEFKQQQREIGPTHLSFAIDNFPRRNYHKKERDTCKGDGVTMIYGCTYQKLRA